MPTPVVIDGVEFEGEDLNPEESQIFDTQFDRLIAPLKMSSEKTLETPQGAAVGGAPPAPGTPVLVEHTHYYADDAVTELMFARKDHFKAALKVAKNLLGGTFKGVSGHGAELVFAHIRPWNFLRKARTAETPAETWDNWLDTNASGTFTGQYTAWAQALNYWMGTGANLGTSTAATAMNIDKRVLLVVVGFADAGPTHPVQTVQIQIDNILFPPTVCQPWFNINPFRDRIAIVPSKTYVFPPRAVVLSTAYVDAARFSVLMPIGIAIGQASYLINNLPLTTVTL